jgi:hypothetical protein
MAGEIGIDIDPENREIIIKNNRFLYDLFDSFPPLISYELYSIIIQDVGLVCPDIEALLKAGAVIVKYILSGYELIHAASISPSASVGVEANASLSSSP